MKPEENQSFSEQLNHLFEIRTDLNGKPYTNEEVGRAIGLTGAAISKMRTGKTKNPSHQAIRTLADFFGVSPAYFFPDAGQVDVDEQLSMLALRASHLSPEGKQVLLDMLEHILKLEEARE